MKNILGLFGLILNLCAYQGIAQDSTRIITTNHNASPRADDHAPIGVMGDHIHCAGEWMFSYRFMTMSMNGSLQKSDPISEMDIYKNYMVAPQTMSMQMHMVGAMYAPSDWITVMLMGNYVMSNMNLKMMSGMEFATQSSGMADLKLSGLIKILHKNDHKIHGNLGVSIPTGSIAQTDDTPMMKGVTLAYPMQLGSGTWDPFLGLTYAGKGKAISWGVQALYDMKFMDNERDYRLGNKISATSWLAAKASNSFSFSGRLKFAQASMIQGQDATMNPMMMPLFKTSNSGTRALDGSLGANYLVTKGGLKNLRMAIEFSYPLLQNVHGIQMKREWVGIAGLQYAFGQHKH